MIKVFIVEDNDFNMDSLTRFLSRKGFEVTGAGTGGDALRDIPVAAPDVVLMDVGLPDMTGYDVVRQLKADQGTASIPIIALTAHALDADRQQAFDAGCVDFDTKPVDIARLVEKIGAATET